jgi:3D (Asp-Asp-Asp) domain-containing protein
MKRKNNGIGIMVALTIVAFHAGVICFFATLETGSARVPQRDGDGGLEQGCPLSGFTITAYCPGSCCNGRWEGKTAHGIDFDVFKALGISVAAVDPAVIPLGSVILYGDRLYFAADTGGLIKGKRIDLLMEKHDDTVRFGVRQNQTVILHSVKTESQPGSFCTGTPCIRAI